MKIGERRQLVGSNKRNKSGHDIFTSRYISRPLNVQKLIWNPLPWFRAPGIEFQAASAPPNGLGLVSVVQNVDGCGKNVSRTQNYNISNPERNDEIVAKTDLDTLAGHFRLVRSRMRPMGGDSTCRSPCHARKRGPNVRDRYRGSPARNRSTKNRKNTIW